MLRPNKLTKTLGVFLWLSTGLGSVSGQEYDSDWHTFSANDQSGGCFLTHRLSSQFELFMYADPNEGFAIGVSKAIDELPFAQNSTYEVFLDGKHFIKNVINAFRPHSATLSGLGAEEQGWGPVLHKVTDFTLIIEGQLLTANLADVPSATNGLQACVDSNGGTELEGRLADSDKEIIAATHKANDLCRGGPGNKLETWGECEKRDLYSDVLSRRGYCYGRLGEASYQQRWHRCDLGSNKNPISKSVEWVPY